MVHGLSLGLSCRITVHLLQLCYWEFSVFTACLTFVLFVFLHTSSQSSCSAYQWHFGTASVKNVTAKYFFSMLGSQNSGSEWLNLGSNKVMKSPFRAFPVILTTTFMLWLLFHIYLVCCVRQYNNITFITSIICICVFVFFFICT